MDQAISFFQVDAQIDAALKIDTVDRKVDVIGQNVQSVLAAVTTASAIVTEYPSADLPSKPDALFGREEYIDNVAVRLCSDGAPGGPQPAFTSPRLAILGPGGIGKTTVALAAVSDRSVKSIYGDRIHWVPCEEATSPELLIELIARSLGVPKGSGADRKREIVDFLRSSNLPRLLLLDNFETPWDIPKRQMDVDNILFDIASASSLAILLTMRSDLPPSTRMRWTKPTLPPLAALSLSAARELYLDIHEEAESDTDLDSLLHELAYMPLAVRLMANRGRWGEMPTGLLKSWKDERLRTKLLHQGDNRVTSIMVSVELSINSNIMARNPEALTLLSILAELPAGARREFIKDIATTVVDHNGALATLRQVALIQAHPTTQHLQLLSPVRSTVLEKHRANPDLRTSIDDAYFDLIEKYKSEPGDDIFLEAVKVLGVEAVNIETLLLAAVANRPSDTCIEAAYSYADFQRFGVPRADIIEKAVDAVQAMDRGDGLLPDVLALKADIYYRLSRHVEAMDARKQALVVYRNIGDQEGEANSLDMLGQVLRALGRGDESLDARQQALAIYKTIDSQIGQANALKGLASTYLGLGRNEDAISVSKEALALYESMGQELGQASSLSRIAASYRGLGQYEAAVDAGKEALMIQKRIGYPLAEANSLLKLGLTYQSLGRDGEAEGVTRKALDIYRSLGNNRGIDDCRLLLQELGVNSL